MNVVLIYDNLCYSCTKYAMLVDSLTNHSIQIMGHYTQLGKEYKRNHFGDYDGVDMSWFIIDGIAYGGRAGLIRLLRYILFSKKHDRYENTFTLNECTTDCKTVKGVLFRSFSILTSYKTFKIQ